MSNSSALSTRRISSDVALTSIVCDILTRSPLLDP
eukprot:CAMPEP_0197402426 /NCGR_PEP_ID=MMETSP1165-20131217/20044_1 /TAXON_ID=284809 /ORGANISM="Chrysocystis fragilis, Strain CCMP3189" /LENGTH=34 /DNA_ID= /DNA_START= /DNA_END= /DNA_ORIENTATION=